jgi:tetratricopeptide (TPR) repeat protein
VCEKEWVFFFEKLRLPGGRAVTREEAEEFLLEQLEERGGCCRKTLRVLAGLRMMMGKHSLALSHFHKLLQMSDDVEENAVCFLGLGGLMEREADFASAAEYYRTGILLKPARRDIWYWLNNNLGFCLNQLKRYDEAEGCLYSAIRAAPRISNAYKNLGLCFQGKGDYVRSAKCLILALKVNASDDRPLNHLEELLENHPEILRDIPDLPMQIDMCRKAVECAQQAQPDLREHWEKLRREQRGKVPVEVIQ